MSLSASIGSITTAPGGTGVRVDGVGQWGTEEVLVVIHERRIDLPERLRNWAS
jgi:hypothetical protein